MRTVVLIVIAYIAAHAIFYGVGWYADSISVTRVPERGLRYEVADLVKIADSQPRYIVPILLPLDVVVMFSLAGALAWAGYVFGAVAFPGWPAFAFLIPPLAYLAFDIAEDGFLAMLLGHLLPITASSVMALKVLTAVKLAAIVASEAMVLITGAVAAWRTWAT